MKTLDFDFFIPEHLIAQSPTVERSDSRMLVFDRKSNTITDSYVYQLTQFIDSQYHLVFNNSKVIPCRIPVVKVSSGKNGELLVVKINDPFTITALTDSNKRYKENTIVELPDGNQLHTLFAEDPLYRIFKSENPIFSIDYLNTYGSLPLPPYIKKKPDEIDKERYQTMFSSKYGSSAAPTAGLHFDSRVFNSLKESNINYSYVSLHVGLGTFKPIYTETIEEHIIHREEYDIDNTEALRLNEAIQSGKKILPIGTTSLRTIESAFNGSEIIAGTNSTELYITPGYTLQVADSLFTNFHTPKSSLAVLVSSITGYDNFKKIYAHAVDREYRFFSYGDAMLIL